MFIDEWFGDDGYYTKLPLDFRNRYEFGQVFWTHAYYPHEHLEIWRPVPEENEPTKTIAKTFRIQAAGQDAFRRSLPIAVPALPTDEEFLVVRAKRRPVVLVQPELPVGFDNRGFRGRLQRRRCTVGQVFGLADPKTGAAAFNPSFVDRVRCMEFAQFLFLPKRAALFAVDSLLRLDEMQSVFTPHLEATQYRLSNAVLEVLRGQIQFLFAGVDPSPYTALRRLLMEDAAN